MRPYVPMLILLLLGFLDARAQLNPVASALPVAYGPSNMGRDFWLAFPANWDEWNASNNNIRLYITSPVRTQVKVWVGATIRHTISTVPNGITTVELTQLEAQLFTRRDVHPVPHDRIYKNGAIHIQAEAPVAVYGVNYTAFSAEGLLALPANALGREYIVASHGASVGGTAELPSQYMIIAPYDGTTVTIHHPHRTQGHEENETFTIQLESRDVWSAMTVGYGGDMTGVVIKSNKPVAVTAGLACGTVPNERMHCCCNHLAEMLLPTETWGKVYHAVPFATRVKGAIYRVLAKEPNTKVYINGLLHRTLDAVGGQESMGWFEYRSSDLQAQEFTADKPIQVVQYNTARSYDQVEAEPFYMILTPLEQYRNEGIFCTPSTNFPRNYLNIICDKEDLFDLEITFAGADAWRPLWTGEGGAEPKKFVSAINGRIYVGVTVKLTAGIYQVRSRRPFAGYAYGFSEFDSYGYPIWTGADNLTTSDSQAPDIRKNQSCDGTVEATVTEKPDNPGTRSNISTIELAQTGTDNYALEIAPFQPGISAEATYRLTVQDKNRPARAVVIISDMAGNIRLDSILYRPLNVIALLSSHDYGKVRLGEVSGRSIAITNQSDNPVELQEIRLKSRAQGFTVVSPTDKVVLGPKGSPTASVDVRIEYTAAIIKPGLLQVYEDSVGIRDNCGLRYLVLVKAQIVKPMIRVTDHDFGPNPLNKETTPPWQMEIRNTSPLQGSMLTVTAMTGPLKTAPGGAKIFDVKSGTALTLPFTLEPNETRNLEITYTAPAAGMDNDAIRFMSDAMEASEDDSTGFLNGQGIITSSVGAPAGVGGIESMEILPNPANGEKAVLEYSIARNARISIELVDVQGRMLRVIQINVPVEAGRHHVALDIAGLAAGTYFARIINGREHRTQRFVIVQ